MQRGHQYDWRVLLIMIEAWLSYLLCDPGQVSSLCLRFLIYKTEILVSYIRGLWRRLNGIIR